MKDSVFQQKGIQNRVDVNGGMLHANVYLKFPLIDRFLNPGYEEMRLKRSLTKLLFLDISPWLTKYSVSSKMMSNDCFFF